MGKNTSVSLGEHFETFVESKIIQGRYKNTSEVIRAGLQLLEDEENRISILKKAIQEGLNSGVVEDFDRHRFLKKLKAERANG